MYGKCFQSEGLVTSGEVGPKYFDNASVCVQAYITSCSDVDDSGYVRLILMLLAVRLQALV